MTRLQKANRVQVTVQEMADRAPELAGPGTPLVVGQIFGWETEMGMDIVQQHVVQQRVLGNSHRDVAIGVCLRMPLIVQDIPHEAQLSSSRLSSLPAERQPGGLSGHSGVRRHAGVFAVVKVRHEGTWGVITSHFQ